MSDTFVCSLCGGEFEKSRPDDEAEAEAVALWGMYHASRRADMAIVCDECFQMMIAEAPPSKEWADQ